MLKEFIIIKHLTFFILPYVFVYSLYIQINGEISPGGGFQAGVIFASAIIGFDLIYGKLTLKYLPTNLLVFTAAIGVIIYATTGIVSLLFDDNYLNYYSLAKDKLLAQSIGIFVIEAGVGLTVASIMCLIYSIITYCYFEAQLQNLSCIEKPFAIAQSDSTTLHGDTDSKQKPSSS